MFDNFSKLTKAKLTTPIKVTIRVFRAIFNSSKSFFSLSNSAIFYLFANCIKNKFKYRQIRDERIVMKQNKDKRQQPRKIVLNSTFGASKDVYNKLYDPLQANNICITGQLLLTDLIEKLENHCQLIQLT